MTGGFYVMTDSFGNPVFKESFKKFFEVDENGDLKMGFLANHDLLALNFEEEVDYCDSLPSIGSIRSSR